MLLAHFNKQKSRFIYISECQWSSTLNQYCSFGSSCQSVRCCLPLTQNNDSRSFTMVFNIKLSELSLQFEKWFYNETILLRLYSGKSKSIACNKRSFLKLCRLSFKDTAKQNLGWLLCLVLHFDFIDITFLVGLLLFIKHSFDRKTPLNMI